MNARLPSTLLVVFLLALPASALQPQAISPVRPERLSDGISLALPGKTLRLQVLSDTIIRVRVTPFPAAATIRPSIMVLPRTVTAPRFAITAKPGSISLDTAKLRATVDLATGQVQFLRPDGSTILAEARNGHIITAATVASGASEVQTFHVQRQWLSTPGDNFVQDWQYWHADAGLPPIRSSPLSPTRTPGSRTSTNSAPTS